MNLQKLYDEAKKHKDEHKSCGGEPYKSFLQLQAFVETCKNGDESISVPLDFATQTPLKILEIGTAVGFTTLILQNKINHMDTVELHADHIELAKKNIETWGGDISKINFHTGDASDILPKLYSPFQKGGVKGIYDIIFFDGYGVKNSFFPYFDLLLKNGGFLITANQHLKSTEKEYFNNFTDNSKWQFIKEFADTMVYKKLC